MKYYSRQLEDPEGDLWDIAQEVKRLSDLCASYNLAVSFVDRVGGQPIELDFNVTLKAPDGTVEGEYNEQRTDGQPKRGCPDERYGQCLCC